MFSRKSVGPRMDFCRTSSLTGYLCKDFHSEPCEAVYHLEKTKWGQMPDLKFHKVFLRKPAFHAL